MPGGQHLAFVSNRSGYYAVWVMTMATGELRQLSGNQENLYYLNRLDWATNRQVTYSVY